MTDVMTACVILHNMITESERGHSVIDLDPWHRQGPLAVVGGPEPSALVVFLAIR
jgi:hypothetical protein